MDRPGDHMLANESKNLNLSVLLSIDPLIMQNTSEIATTNGNYGPKPLCRPTPSQFKFEIFIGVLIFIVLAMAAVCVWTVVENHKKAKLKQK